MRSNFHGPAPVRNGAPQRRKKRSYSYNVRRIRRDLSYTVQEVAELFGIHAQAVRRWITQGLPTIDDRKPVLIHGRDLIGFLARRRFDRKRRCRPDEFFCCRCRQPKRARDSAVDINIRNASQLTISGCCEDCGARMNCAGSVRNLDHYAQIFNVRTMPEGHIRENAPSRVMGHISRVRDDVPFQS